MPSFSMTAINGNSNTAIVVVGFCINQLPVFPLPALRSTLRNILDAAVILFLFFSKSVFPYKTPSLLPSPLSIEILDLNKIKKNYKISLKPKLISKIIRLDHTGVNTIITNKTIFDKNYRYS